MLTFKNVDYEKLMYEFKMMKREYEINRRDFHLLEITAKDQQLNLEHQLGSTKSHGDYMAEESAKRGKAIV